MAADQRELRYGPLGNNCVHVCVDMQRLFAEDTEWKTPWMDRVLPKVHQLVAARPARTIFTRFIPAQRPGQGYGTWRRYYERWSAMTIEKIGFKMVELVPELAVFVPPAMVLDKRVYSPWHETWLDAHLRGKSVNTLVVSGGETDVCVLSTVLGAVDRGYRTVIATDALCSSSDETHDALLAVYEKRYSQQVEAVKTDVILGDWS
jgi:nicotinamidase-related amidase